MVEETGRKIRLGRKTDSSALDGYHPAAHYSWLVDSVLTRLRGEHQGNFSMMASRGRKQTCMDCPSYPSIVLPLSEELSKYASIILLGGKLFSPVKSKVNIAYVRESICLYFKVQKA